MKLQINQLAMGLLCFLLSAVMMAQVTTEKTTIQGQPTVQTTVERGEVVYVSGNDLVVKMEDGQIRNFSDIPESARVTVGGQQLSIHDLKPGMKLERTISTTTTPQTVTTVQTVTGRVWQVRPPLWVTLTLDDGSHQQFKIPEGQRFMVNGQETDAFGLKKGMEVSATKIVTAPENAISEKRTVTGEMPPPPQTAAIQGPLLIVVERRPVVVAQAKTAEAQPQPKKLPQTASELPFIGLVGTLMVLSGVVFLLARSRAHYR
ncbi:MAG TPA: hypothetical protein VIX19_10345 [Terriglobales bacterium]